MLLLVSAGLAVADKAMGYSALLGGLISIVPNTYFACSTFRYSGARAASNIARSIYLAEVLKFVFSAALFACVFVLVKPIAAGTLFTAFILTTVVNTMLIFKLANS